MTPRGAVVEVVTDFPAGPGPFATVVLAPGQGYHLAQPAMEQTAQRIVEQGIAVYRFNWAYFTRDPKQGQPSEDLSHELQELQGVVQQARADTRVAPTQLVVGGKSMGSVVAWQALALDSSLRAGLFLTPICSRVPQGQTAPTAQAVENYPGITQEQRPLLFISGDHDPLCSPPILLAFAATAGSSARVAIVSGDHNYCNRNLNGPAYETARNRNIQLVAQLCASFAADVVGR